MPVRLKLEKSFQPCLAEPGDELYPNGIFEFNIRRLLAFVAAHAERFPIERVEVGDIADYGSDHLDEEAIGMADLSRPILLAEISPGLYNVIDGHHRLAKARREGAQELPARGSIARTTLHSSHPAPRTKHMSSTGMGSYTKRRAVGASPSRPPWECNR